MEESRTHLHSFTPGLSVSGKQGLLHHLFVLIFLEAPQDKRQRGLALCSALLCSVVRLHCSLRDTIIADRNDTIVVECVEEYLCF